MPFDYERLRRATLAMRRTPHEAEQVEGEGQMPDAAAKGTLNLINARGELESLPQIYRPRINPQEPYHLEATRVTSDPAPDEWAYSFIRIADMKESTLYHKTRSPEGETWHNAENALQAGRKHIDAVEAEKRDSAE